MSQYNAKVLLFQKVANFVFVGGFMLHGLPKQATYWQMDQHVKRKPGRPRKNWIDTICQDLKTIGMAWEDAEECAANREDWHRSVAQCV